MNSSFTLPFGGLIKKVKQSGRIPKSIFILGNYSNAVNAEWLSPDNSILVKNLPIATEPSPFWSGENCNNIVKWVKLPIEFGSLSPSNEMVNGQDGITLNAKYLSPQNLSRDDVWLCNLVPYPQVFLSQRRDIEEYYMPLREKHSLQMPNIPDFKTAEFRASVRINEIVNEIETVNPSLIISLGDDPINHFFRKVSNLAYKTVKDVSDHQKGYGKDLSITLNKKSYSFLALYHPRQLNILGKLSQLWNQEHDIWAQSRSSLNSRFL